jgi:ribosome-associated protein
MTSLDTALACRAALEDTKGRNIVILDLRNLSSVTDYFVIVSGSSQPHLRALQDGIHAHLKEQGVTAYRRSVDPEGSWLCLDYVDVVVHIMSEEAREYYTLEELWAEAPRV